MDMNAAAAGESQGYSNEFVEVQTVYDDASITAACFDSLQELYWTGNSEGRVTSYFGMGLAKYTSFKPKQGEAADIRQLISYPGGDLFVLNSDVLSAYTRTGVNTLRYKGTSFQNMQCMFLNQQQRLFLGGFCPHIYDFDFERMRVLRQLSIADEQSDCIMIKSNVSSSSAQRNHGILCTGCSNGQIVLRDPSSLKQVHKFHPHSGSLSDFDVHGNYLVSCGFSLTRSGNLCVDRFLMVYDVRMMRSLTPVQVMIEPCFIHFLPMCSSVASVASQAGCFQIMDINLMTPSAFYQAQVPMGGLATTFSMSGNSQSFAFGHSSGSIHLFSKGENEFFNHYSEPTYFVEQPPINTAYIDINHEMAPLSSIPMPLVYRSLVSDWPNKDYNPKYRPTPPISAELTENARVLNNIASVPNKTNMVRNQIYNESYRKLEVELEEKSRLTSIDLAEMAVKFAKPEPPPPPTESTTTSQSPPVEAVDQVDSSS